MLKKTFVLGLLPAILVALSFGLAQATTVTIATFADPSTGSGNPLFTVDLVSDTITGGWADSKTGLYLVIPYSGNNSALSEKTAVGRCSDKTGLL